MRGVVFILALLLCVGFASAVRMECVATTIESVMQDKLDTGRYRVIGVFGQPGTKPFDYDTALSFYSNEFLPDPSKILGWVVCGFEDFTPGYYDTDYPFSGCDEDFLGNPFTHANYLDYVREYDASFKKYFYYVEPSDSGSDDLCISSVWRNMTCGEVSLAWPDDGYEKCQEADWQTCVGLYEDGKKYYYRCDDADPEDIPPPSGPAFWDTAVCCNVSQEPILTLTNGTIIGMINVTPQCLGGTMPYCEAGESLHGKFWWFPVSNVNADIKIYYNSSNTSCSMDPADPPQSLQEMVFYCPTSPCEGEWLVPQIPYDCTLSAMNSSRISLHHVTGNTPDRPYAGSDFIFGYHVEYNDTIEVESNVTNPNFKWFTSANWTLLAKVSPENAWVVREYANLSPATDCFEKQKYKSLYSLLDWTHQSWGGCQGSGGASMFSKVTPLNMTNGTGMYYVSLFGIFGPDSEKSETLTVDINLTRVGQVRTYELGDIWNTTEFFLENLTDGPKGSVYSGCTIPEAIPLNPNDSIKITYTGDNLFLDYINISTEPNPQGIPNCSNTEMKCGWFTDNPPWPQPKTIIGRACNTTTPVPQRAMCGNTDPTSGDCVYGNESGTPLPENECYAAGSDPIVNANGTEIFCGVGNEGYWCPVGFNWNDVLKRCEPDPYLCDYGPSDSTDVNCTYFPSEGHPGFMNDVTECLNDFDGYPSEGPEWESACCEFLRVARAGDSDYLFFNEKTVKIY